MTVGAYLTKKAILQARDSVVDTLSGDNEFKDAVVADLVENNDFIEDVAEASIVAYPFIDNINPEAEGAVTFTANDSVTGSLSAETVRAGNFYQTTLTLDAVRVAITDATTSGSYGSLSLGDFPGQFIHIINCSQDYTAFSSDGTGVPNDAIFDIGLGTEAIDTAADGTLGATEDDIGAAITIDLDGVDVGSDLTLSAIADTSKELELNLNVSGTAATVDDNGTLDVTGTIIVTWMALGGASV